MEGVRARSSLHAVVLDIVEGVLHQLRQSVPVGVDDATECRPLLVVLGFVDGLYVPVSQGSLEG